ncbi:MAG: tRNA lysidine(34) synthetase TilS [Caldilineaceae bacterium]
MTVDLALSPTSLYQQCQAMLARCQLILGTPEKALTIVVAVSGGADSCSLLHLLRRQAPEAGLRLHVAHVDHGLRTDSGEDARFVEALATAYGLPFTQKVLPPGLLLGARGGVEAAARQARYAFLAEVALHVTPATQPPLIALAHHADDQAETLLLHLVRGSGLAGLEGMRWLTERWASELTPDTLVADDRHVAFIRPLLNVRRAAILQYLQDNQLAWREDSTNAQTTYARNRLRHMVIPELAAINPGLVATLNRTAELLQGEADRLQALDRAALIQLLADPDWSLAQLTHHCAQSLSYRQTYAPTRLVLDRAGFVALPNAAQRGVLRAVIGLLAPALTDLGLLQLDQVVAQIQATTHAGGPYSLLGDLAWSVAAQQRIGATAQRPARLSLHQISALPFAPEHPYLDAAWQANPGSLPLTPPCRLTLQTGWQLRCTLLSRADLPVDWLQRVQPWEVYLDAKQVGQMLLTTPQAGMRFAPLGMQGHHKLLGDFFTDHKVPVTLRLGWPVTVDAASGELIWVCGYQPAHSVRITAATTSVLHLQWRQDE